MTGNMLRKSNISKERALALDELLPDKSNQYDSSPGVYVRSDKDRELDILWQGYRVNNKEERNPWFYLIIGFLAGVICSMLMSFLINLGTPSKENISDLNMWKKTNTTTSNVNLNVIPSDKEETVNTVKTTEYVVKSGDTIGSIAYKFYGSVDPSKIEKIQTANNMKSVDSIQIDQKLIIPMED